MITGCVFSNKGIVKTRPIKYYIDSNFVAVCDGYYIYDTLVKIICLYEGTNDTMVEEYFDRGKMVSTRNIYYQDGSLKEEGQLFGGHPVGIRKKYYPSGRLKVYEYNNFVNGKSDLYYYKKYDTTGALVAVYLPLTYWTNNDDTVFEVGKQYELYFKLMYSEYDSVTSWVLTEPSPESGVKGKKEGFIGPAVRILFTPQTAGQHEIKGTYFETNAYDSIPNVKRVASSSIHFDYKAERRERLRSK